MPALSGLFIGDSMDRQIVYPGQILPETSLLQMAKDSMIGLAKLSAAVLGTSTMANGFAVTPTGPASLQVVCAPGEIYSLTSIDALAFSTLPADTAHSIMKQGILLDGVTLSCPAPGTGGQSINYLVQATYQDSDSAPVLLPYYNSANPALPYSGMGNNGLTQNTNRKGIAVVAVKAGASAVTGSQVTPAPDAGYVGLYVVTVAFGQTTITTASIAQYSGAPLLPSGLLQAMQNAATTGGTDIGTANAYAANFTPAITALTDKMVLCIKAVNANTAASTFTPAPGVIATSPIVGGNHSALQGGEIAVNGDVWLQWNSSIGAGSWVLIDSTGGGMQIAPATKSLHAVQLTQGQTMFAGPIGSVSNLKMSVATASVSATVTADEVVVGTALGGQTYKLSSYSKAIDISTTGAGGRDTGAGINGYVALYAIYNPVSGVSSILGVNVTSSFAPVIYGGANMPAGYTASALLTVVPTNVSGQFVTLNVSNRDVYIPIAAIFNATTILTNSSVSISAIVPQNAVSISGELSINIAVAASVQVILKADASTIGQQALTFTLGASQALLTNFANVPIRTAQTVVATTSTTAGTPTFAAYITSYRI